MHRIDPFSFTNDRDTPAEHHPSVNDLDGASTAHVPMSHAPRTTPPDWNTDRHGSDNGDW